MISRCTDDFWKMYHALPPEIQRAAVKAYRLWRENTAHPSLYFKPIPEKQGVWSVRITRNYRAVCLKRSHGWLWVGIGDHEFFDRI